MRDPDLDEPEPERLIHAEDPVVTVPDAWCWRCQRTGTRIVSRYTAGGLEIADDYCGWCGKNWDLAPRPKKPAVWKVGR